MKNLKELREKRGWTQIEAANHIGVSVVTYRLWENGGGRPSPENYQRILDAFDVLPLELE